MVENEKEPVFIKSNKKEFIFEANALFQHWSAKEKVARGELNIAMEAINSINDILSFITASEEQGLQVTYHKDEETGEFKIDTQLRKPWDGLLRR